MLYLNLVRISEVKTEALQSPQPSSALGATLHLSSNPRRHFNATKRLDSSLITIFHNHHLQPNTHPRLRHSIGTSFKPLLEYHRRAYTMLRRAPTTLSITSEDVAAYEDRREREAMIAAQQEQQRLQQQQQQQQQQHGAQEGAYVMEGVQASPEATRRARDERIGVSRRR